MSTPDSARTMSSDAMPSHTHSPRSANQGAGSERSPQTGDRQPRPQSQPPHQYPSKPQSQAQPKASPPSLPNKPKPAQPDQSSSKTMTTPNGSGKNNAQGSGKLQAIPMVVSDGRKSMDIIQFARIFNQQKQVPPGLGVQVLQIGKQDVGAGASRPAPAPAIEGGRPLSPEPFGIDDDDEQADSLNKTQDRGRTPAMAGGGLQGNAGNATSATETTQKQGIRPPIADTMSRPTRFVPFSGSSANRGGFNLAPPATSAGGNSAHTQAAGNAYKYADDGAHQAQVKTGSTTGNGHPINQVAGPPAQYPARPPPDARTKMSDVGAGITLSRPDQTPSDIGSSYMRYPNREDQAVDTGSNDRSNGADGIQATKSGGRVRLVRRAASSNPGSGLMNQVDNNFYQNQEQGELEDQPDDRLDDDPPFSIPEMNRKRVHYDESQQQFDKDRGYNNRYEEEDEHAQPQKRMRQEQVYQGESDQYFDELQGEGEELFDDYHPAQHQQGQHEVHEEEEHVEQAPFDPMAEVIKFDAQTELVNEWDRIQNALPGPVREFSIQTLTTAYDIIIKVAKIYYELNVAHQGDLETGVGLIRKEENMQEDSRRAIINFSEEMKRAHTILKQFGQGSLFQTQALGG